MPNAFEIVETVLIDDFDAFNSFVLEVKKLGSSVAVDDFGSGYSSLSYLLSINFDILKFDGSLIKNIKNQKNFDLLKTIIAYTKMHKITTVAEHVENYEIFNIVCELGIDFSQGYYFSKPLRSNELQNFKKVVYVKN